MARLMPLLPLLAMLAALRRSPAVWSAPKSSATNTCSAMTGMEDFARALTSLPATLGSEESTFVLGRDPFTRVTNPETEVPDAGEELCGSRHGSALQ